MWEVCAFVPLNPPASAATVDAMLAARVSFVRCPKLVGVHIRALYLADDQRASIEKTPDGTVHIATADL